MENRLIIGGNLDSNYELKNKRSLTHLVLLLSFIFGAGIGWLGFLLFGDLAAGSNIIYVSQKEILRLEKERVSQQSHIDELHIGERPISGQALESSLFFGKINQALELIKIEAQKYKNRTNKVIFIVDEFITGEAALSVSKYVHQNVIENLAKTIKLNSDDKQPINMEE